MCCCVVWYESKGVSDKYAAYFFNLLETEFYI